MAGVRYPIEIVRDVPVVAAPEEIDVSNAGLLQAVLGEAAALGHGTLVVDMTGTRFCASAGLGALVRAHNRAGPTAASCGWWSPPAPWSCACSRSPDSIG